MAPPSISIKLLRPSALQLSADEPCILEMHIPIALPHRLDPSLPAPPYHTGTILPHDFRDRHAISVFRPLMAQVLAHMLGSASASSDPDADPAAEHVAAANAAVSRLGFDVATSPSDSYRLFDSWEADTVFDKESGFDLERGYWKNKKGEKHRGVIRAFDDVFDRIIIYHTFVLRLVCGTGEAAAWKEANPRVVRFDVVPVEEEEEGDQGWDGGEVVFEVKEYTENARRRVNAEVAMPMADWGAPEAPATEGA
ncbi:uncharacterized protein B0H64DRAFT_374723 [Chaetomium fimeti]|uniref:Uncharacterized protein n=1 Tax=Chaetomium fimeti TaxID=1854472 RepID=A0AAE0HCE7_9PEZI|nr:hypothetical protein B0H64DRAFT_374723 [Chaetomium fimeti]